MSAVKSQSCRCLQLDLRHFKQMFEIFRDFCSAPRFSMTKPTRSDHWIINCEWFGLVKLGKMALTWHKNTRGFQDENLYMHKTRFSK